MQVIVLGSAAGGGFPQWNCNCPNCDGVRSGQIRARARTQSSIAVSGNGQDWVLINASPDVLAQIRATPALQPARSRRDTGIVAVMLMDAQIDHVTGLLMLREGRTLPLYCTEAVWQDLNTGLPIAKVLSHYCGVHWHPLKLASSQNTGVPGSLSGGIEVPGIEGIRFTPIALSSKAPPYSPHRHAPEPGDNIGLLIENTHNGKRLFYAPGLGKLGPQVWAAMAQADCVMVDGTCWTDDEMMRLGLAQKTSLGMGHLPISGPEGMMAQLDRLGDRRKVLIHINNSNPVLNEAGGEAAELARHGIELAYDGMEITL